MRRPHDIWLTMLLLLGVLCSPLAYGASVAPDGSHIGVDGGVRNTMTVLDPDGDGDYGTDGSIWFAVTNKEGFPSSETTNPGGPDPQRWSTQAWDMALLDRKPAYVNTLTPGTTLTSSGGWGYDNVDDPDDDGATPFESGGGVTNGDSGSERDVISFTLGGAPVPEFIRLGVYVDNNDGAANFTPASLRVEVTGNSAMHEVTSADIMGDLYFFGIGSAAPGDVITLFSTDRPGGSTLDVIGGIVFDSGSLLFEQADFNFDTTVDIADFQILADNFLTGTTREQGDADLNGTVDLVDFRIWKQTFESAGAGASVPEPASLPLIGLSAAVVFLSQRRSKRV